MFENNMNKTREEFSAARNIILFLDAFLAFLIVLGSRFIIDSHLGRTSILFGFIMLCITLVLKLSRNW